MIGPLAGPWLIAAAVLLLALAARRGERPQRREVVWLALLVAGGAAARRAFGLWGPLHVNGQGPLWVRGALDASVLSGSYGPGYFESLGWLARAAPAADSGVFAGNVLLSAISPALLYVAARLVGVARGGALAAAVVLAADPVSVRTAASEGYYSPLIALLLGVYVALGCSLRAGLRRDRPAVGLALVAAGLFAAAAARLHPVGYLPIALAPLIVLSAAQPERWRTRLRRTVVAAAAIAAVVLLTSGQAILVALRAPIAGSAVGALPPGQWMAVLIAFGAACVLQRWARPPWLPLLGVASLLCLLATQASFRMHPVQTLSYQRLFWPGLLLGLAPLLPRLRHSAAWGLAAAAAVTIIALVGTWSDLTRPTTEQLEYRFLRQALRDMPPDCTLAAVSRADKRQWAIPSFLAPGVGAQRSVESAADLAAAPGACLLYVRASLCSSSEARAICEAIERQAPLERLAAGVFPAAPSYAGLPYDRDAVETVLFRVTAHRLGVNDGVAITPAFAQTVYAGLTTVREADGCTVAGVATSRFRITVALQPPSGAAHRIELAAAAPGSDATASWTVAADGDAEHACGATLARIRAVLAEIGTPAPEGATQPTG